MTRVRCLMLPPSWVVIGTRSTKRCSPGGRRCWPPTSSGSGAVSALGLDETLFGREGRWRTRRWCTSIVDVCGGQLLDVVAGRDAQAPIRWLLAQPSAWREGIAWGTLDLSGAYRRSFDVALPHAGQVADPFHVIRLAQQQHRRGAPPGPKRHLGASRPQTRPALSGAAVAHFGS